MKAHTILAGVAAASLFVSSSFAADAPLPAGKPAGTKDAALLGLSGLPLFALVGFTGLVIAAGAGAFSKGKSGSTNSTTGTSS